MTEEGAAPVSLERGGPHPNPLPRGEGIGAWVAHFGEVEVDWGERGFCLMRYMFSLGLAVGIAVLAAVALAGSASASLIEDDDAFTWSTDDDPYEIVLAPGGSAPNSASLPTATHDSILPLAYELSGNGVWMGHEELSLDKGGGVFVTITSVYYNLGNGMTYNKGGNALLETSLSTTAALEGQTVQWQARSYEQTYSEIDITIRVVTPVSIDQTVTTIDLELGLETTHTLDEHSGGQHDRHVILYLGEFDATTAYSTTPANCPVPGSPCWTEHYGHALERAFMDSTLFESPGLRTTLKLKSPYHENWSFPGALDVVGTYKITIAVLDRTGLGEVAGVDHEVLTVNVNEPTYGYVGAGSSIATRVRYRAKVGETVTFQVPMPRGGLAPFSISGADALWDEWSFEKTSGITSGTVTLTSQLTSGPGYEFGKHIAIQVSDSSTPAQSTTYYFTITSVP